MFTPEERNELRSQLLSLARADRRISGAAITGSAAAGCEDQWSDIDLAFGVTGPDELAGVVADRTSFLYGQHGAVHHTDTHFGGWLYRSFLLANTLQIDLAFAPENEFRAFAPTFCLVFGKANEPQYIPPPAPAILAAGGWPRASHARSFLADGKLWEAEHAVSALRDSALNLACLRYQLPAHHGRGFDLLPTEVLLRFESGLAQSVEQSEIERALEVVSQAFASEAKQIGFPLQAQQKQTPQESLRTGDLIGIGWLHAVHARSSIARGRLWQAEYMIRGLREYTYALACARLPKGAAAVFEEGLVRKTEHAEIQRGFQAAIRAFRGELAFRREEFAGKLSSTLAGLA